MICTLHDKQELEKGMETLNKTHGQEVKALMHKSKLLSQEAEEANQRFERAQTQLKVNKMYTFY